MNAYGFDILSLNDYSPSGYTRLNKTECSAFTKQLLLLPLGKWLLAISFPSTSGFQLESSTILLAAEVFNKVLFTREPTGSANGSCFDKGQTW